MEDAKLVTEAIVSALKSGPILQSNLAPDSIGSVILQVGEAIVDVSWYSEQDPCSGNVRGVLVNGEGLPVSSRQTAEIVRAAQLRSVQLRKEKLAVLVGRKPRGGG